MPNYASNAKISGPVRIGATPDVDFNGMMWSYTVGLMFPPQAAEMTVPQSRPNTTQIYVPGGQ